MARPSKNTDRQLIATGRKLLPTTGVSGLSLRQVAQEAGVNLGMFNYHFGTKDEFVRVVLQEVYEEFFSDLEEEFIRESKVGSSIDKLRSMLLVIGKFVLKNRELLASVMRDILNGEKVVYEFLLANGPRHIGLIAQVVGECQKKGQIRKDTSVAQVVVTSMFGIAVPVVIGTGFERVAPKPIKALIKRELVSLDVLEKRVDVVLKGLKP